MTVLSNGVRVVSEELFSQTAHVGVMMDAGAVDEHKAGTANIFLKLASGSGRTRRRPTEEIRQRYEEISGLPHANVQKEVLAMSLDSFRDQVPAVVEQMSESLLQPDYHADDVEQMRQVVELEIDQLAGNHFAWLNDELNAVALSSPYSLPAVALPSDSAVDVADVQRFHQFAADPSRLVVAAVGVDHQQFVATVARQWNSSPSSSSSATIDGDHPVAKYTARPVLRLITIEERTAELNKRRQQAAARLQDADYHHLNVEHKPPEHSHILLGFQGPSITDADFHAMCVVNTMLGGGTSFSAGGPGKGMFARLYLHALNRYDWIRTCNSFFSPFRHLSVSGIYGECHHDAFYSLLEVMVNELLGVVVNPPNATELTRAKNLLKSQLFTAVDQRALLWEDLARQTLAYGQKIPIAEHVRIIDAITQQDVHRVARKILASPPVMVAHTYKTVSGSTNNLHNILADHIRNHLPPA